MQVLDNTNEHKHIDSLYYILYNLSCMVFEALIALFV